jgi:hypothetical protein
MPAWLGVDAGARLAVGLNRRLADQAFTRFPAHHLGEFFEIFDYGARVFRVKFGIHVGTYLY